MPEDRSESSGFLPGWDALDRWTRSRLIESSKVWLVVVPVAVTALAKAPDALAIDTGGENPLVVSLQLPFSWLVLWCAALAGFAAQLLVYGFAPASATRFPTYASFRDSGESHHFLLDDACRTVWLEQWLPRTWQSFDPGEALLIQLQHLARAVGVKRSLVNAPGDDEFFFIAIHQGALAVGGYQVEHYSAENPIHQRAITPRVLSSPTTKYVFLTGDEGREPIALLARRNLLHFASRSLWPLRATAAAALVLAHSAYGWVLWQGSSAVIRYWVAASPG